MKHIHADVIHRYAEGEQVQLYDDRSGKWVDTLNPSFHEGRNYRIKPEPKPDLVYMVVINVSLNGQFYAPCIRQSIEDANLKIVFDGETNKLISAEVLNGN
jgi:hypothetical protein